MHSLRAHLLQVETSTGVRPPELDTPEAPPGAVHVLDLFREIATARTSGLAGPLPLAWSELEAWQRLVGHALEVWEVRLVRALDIVWLEVWQQCQPADSPAGGSPAAGRPHR